MRSAAKLQLYKHLYQRRYFPPDTCSEMIELVKSLYPSLISFKKVIGHSVHGLPIDHVTVGSGTKKVLMWSQMHGDESTSTRALFLLLDYIGKAEPKWMSSLTLHIIPQLNPDGAKAFTRLNAADIDLNRDAIDQSQPETEAFFAILDQIKPDLCLNLHGQRSIYGIQNSSDPCAFSFLAPAAEVTRGLTQSRQLAMNLIAATVAEMSLDNRFIGRYSDRYDPRCYGDDLTAKGNVVVLFESGVTDSDYERNRSMSYTYEALVGMLKSFAKSESVYKNTLSYDKIPEVTKSFSDLWVRWQDGGVYVRFRESVRNHRIQLTPVIDDREGVKFCHREVVVTHDFWERSKSDILDIEFNDVASIIDKFKS